MPEAYSEEMVRALFAQRPRPIAYLVTLASEGIEPIRATDWSEPLTVSGEVYRPYPFQVAWGGGSRDEPERQARIIMGASGEAVELIRAAEREVTATIDLVRVAAPGVAERTLNAARLGTAEVDGAQITITLRGRDYANEPACRARYTRGRCPSL